MFIKHFCSKKYIFAGGDEEEGNTIRLQLRDIFRVIMNHYNIPE